MTQQQTAYTVSQITGYLRVILETDEVLSNLWITGEVSNHSRAGSGHHYFTLRDAEGALRCVQFKPARGAEFLKDGAQVIAHGRVSIYTVRGDLQFYVDVVRPDGLGALQQAFEELKLRLQQEGLFDPGRKRPIPRFPKRIGIVTSPTGAAIQDILNVLSRRYALAEVVLAPTPVQGDAAAPGIVESLAAINAEPDIDVVIVARGGGSMEDLWAFNEEMVARAIFASHVPVVSGVGHETDTTIADLVADLRAPTPSAAAELVVPDRRELIGAVAAYGSAISGTVVRQFREHRTRLDLAVDRLYDCGPDTRQERRRVDELLRYAGNAITRSLERKRERLRSLQMQLAVLDPAAILSRGYAVVRMGPDGEVVTRAGQVDAGDALTIAFSDGEVDASATASRSRIPRSDGTG